MEKLPIYTKNQQKGNQSASLLKSILQKFCILNEIGQEQDVGIDFTGIVLKDSRPSDLCFNVQCKGTDEIENKKLKTFSELVYPNSSFANKLSWVNIGLFIIIPPFL